VLSKGDSSALPTLVIDSEFPMIGSQVSKENLFGLEMVMNLYNTYKINRLKVSEIGLEADYNSKIRVIFPFEGDKQLLVGGLSAIIVQLNEGKEKTKIGDENLCNYKCIIDMRFDKPVIKNI
jgi:hypothetical protein